MQVDPLVRDLLPSRFGVVDAHRGRLFVQQIYGVRHETQ